MGLGLGFALGGAQAGMDERRVKDIQDAEIQHTKERRAIVEPLQDKALGLSVQNAQDEAKYRTEDRPLERQSKEQALATGGLQLQGMKEKMPLEIETLKTNNKIQNINANLAVLHADQYTKEAGIKSMDLRGQRAYGIAKLADMNPTLALDAFNSLPETKSSGVQASWIGYTANPNDPKDKEQYLVAKDDKGNIINFQGPGGKPIPAMFKKSALDVYAPKFDQYDVKDNVMYNKYTGANAPVGVGGGVPHQVSNEAWRMSVNQWGTNGLNGVSFDGKNGDYATQNAALTTKLMRENPSMDLPTAHRQAYQATMAQKNRDEAMSTVSGGTGNSGGQQSYSGPSPWKSGSQ